ncbi:hypothetical protein THAOC_28537, partial [Thalassiosira oceanica]
MCCVIAIAGDERTVGPRSRDQSPIASKSPRKRKVGKGQNWLTSRKKFGTKETPSAKGGSGGQV